jgi:hypothetical protein
VRIRIALTTAIAVIAGMTTGIFTLSTSHQASAQAATHHAQHTGVTWLTHTALSGLSIPEPSSGTSSVIDPQAPKTSGKTAKTSTTTRPPVKATPVVVATPPAPAPVPVTDATSVATTNWTCIRVHESGDQYNNPREPSGAYGILLSTWRSFGYSGWPYEAPVSVQDQLALKLYALYGFRPWSSRFACGL